MDIETPTTRSKQGSRIRRLTDAGLIREAQRRHVAWNYTKGDSARSWRAFLYRVCVNTLQERGLPVPE